MCLYVISGAIEYVVIHMYQIHRYEAYWHILEVLPSRVVS